MGIYDPSWTVTKTPAFTLEANSGRHMRFLGVTQKMRIDRIILPQRRGVVLSAVDIGPQRMLLGEWDMGDRAWDELVQWSIHVVPWDGATFVFENRSAWAVENIYAQIIGMQMRA